MSNKLYVGSLPFSMTNEQLSEIFAPHGNLVSARVITDKISGRSKGFGFVEYDSEDAATRAKQAMHESEVQGRKIVVNDAHPQNNNGGGGPRRSGGGGFRGGDRGPRGGGGFNRDRGDRGNRY